MIGVSCGLGLVLLAGLCARLRRSVGSVGLVGRAQAIEPACARLWGLCARLEAQGTGVDQETARRSEFLRLCDLKVDQPG